jgi:hypothetical protein
MGVLKILMMPLAASLLHGCSSGQPPDPPPPTKTVADPLIQQLDRARGVQKTVDQGADRTRAAVDSEERGGGSP